jgi:hypothetical protein
MHGAAVETAQFDPTDDSTILTASDDGTAKIYRCITCGPLRDVRRLAEERLAAVNHRAIWLAQDAPRAH